MPKKKPKEVKQVPAVLHIYCEGEKTEPTYFRKYLDKNRPTDKRTKVIQVEATKKNTPVQLVEVAIASMRKCPKGDQFWVVFDRESPQKYKDTFHHEAYAKAKAKGINIAISNVCFELWILLHFKTCSASYNNYEDLKNNSELKTELQNIGINNYEKGESKIFDLIQGNIATARQRAKEMNEATIKSSNPDKEKPYQLNPYTDVYKLLDAIDAFV